MQRDGGTITARTARRSMRRARWMNWWRCAQPIRATLLAGSTDIGLWVTKQMRELGDIIYLGHVTALQSVHEADGMLEIGAGVSLNDAYAALCRLSRGAGRVVAALCFAAHPQCGHAGRQCRQRLADRRFDAVDDCAGQRSGAARSAGERVLPLEAFYLDYQKKDMRSDEFVAAVRAAAAARCAVPYLQAGQALRPGYLGRVRRVCLPLDGAVIKDARIALAAWRPRRAALRRRKPRCLVCAGMKPICGGDG
jgi:xanthine dehydrogenase small subunit